MNEAAIKPAPYAQARIREPAGERTLGESFSVGGPGADVVVPGVPDGPALRIERRKGVWLTEPVEPSGDSKPARFDGRPLLGARDLRRNDVVALGDAQLIVTDVSRTLLRLDVSHLVGNATIAPAAMTAALALGEAGDEQLEIRARGTPVIPVPRDSGARWRTISPAVRVARRRFWWIAGGVFALAVLTVTLLSLLESVPLDVQPGDALVRTPGTLLALHSGDRLLMLPGKHVVRAERDGYTPAQTELLVSSNNTQGARLRLQKLPGKLQIDTHGIAATVVIDGVESGHAPGTLEVPAGQHTITLRSPQYVDYIARLSIEGAGARQSLNAILKPSWGSLRVATVPPGARIDVDGAEAGISPATLQLASGVRDIRISAPGLKTWESSVVIKAGEELAIGPVALGQPDAHLTVRSEPAGAEVTIGGTHRGRTPYETDLPAGISHDVVVDLPGFASWQRAVFAEAGHQIALDARLDAVNAGVTVQGEPSDAELLIDGTPRGRTPQSTKLSAVEHRIEVRKEGFLPFSTVVTPAAGLERTIRYHLTSSDHATALQESAPLIHSSSGYALRLVPLGTFEMGSERRDQGRRPNEGLRQVTLKRPFYFGVTEITNGEFRQFHAGHASGFIDTHSIDLDAQPVTQISWDDAAEYCNWLSERDSLPPAYEKKDKGYVLKRPVTTGYRLPTEAEWEYAARYAAPGQFRRFAWGDALPIPEDVGNLAGTETASSLPDSLTNYHDDYPVVAPVGKFKPTPLGLHDLSGNVSEWINDYYFSFVEATPITDPLGPDDGTRHVIRGANWKSAVVTELRLAWRDAADTSGPTLGFRVARYAE
jgi:formylglycine-generating enzyme required for sulfatase activity